MTEVAFHFNVPQKSGYACRLLRKATAGGARVVVTGEAWDEVGESVKAKVAEIGAELEVIDGREL